MKNIRKIHRLKRKQINYIYNKYPRISIFKSSKHFYIQIIDDMKSMTIFNISTLTKKIKNNFKAMAILVSEIENFALQNNIKQFNFDRNGFLYVGNIKLFCTLLREVKLVP